MVFIVSRFPSIVEQACFWVTSLSPGILSNWYTKRNTTVDTMLWFLYDQGRHTNSHAKRKTKYQFNSRINGGTIILLVPPTGAAGSNVVFVCLFFLSSFLRWSSVIFFFMSFSSFLLLIWLKGIVWRGWMTSLICLFRIFWRRGAEHSWRTQDGDGRQGSKVPGGLAGRTWLCFSYHKLLPLPGGCLFLGLPVISPWFLVLLCLQVGMFSFYFIFSSFFSSVCSIPCGRARQFVSHVFFLLLLLVRFVFVFALCFRSFLYFIECVYRACRIQYHVMAMPCLLCSLHRVYTAYVAT